MARHDELPVYRATYTMMVSIFGFVKHFTKEYKYSVGDSLKKETTRGIHAYKPIVGCDAGLYRRFSPKNSIELNGKSAMS